MNTISSASEIIALLRDIEHRSQRDVVGLSQQDILHGTWTAIDFRIAENHYLIPLSETREVFPVPNQITPVPKSKPWVFGIANLRGELLPLFDLKYFLYGQATTVNKRSRIIVINHPELYSGLLLDEVFGLKHFPKKPDYNDTLSDNATSPYINGSIVQQDMRWDIFSFTKLAADPQFLNAAA
ncbi:MAG: chemotaxis protein CheW [Gammaproteobacteria bacterium]|nr:chemotaxis protein CheW [Gammaproteobacteria bacterium]